MKHKSGFVNIIGFPNVGKSTLMNTLVGERMSIITSKAQTTRHRIRGIVNGEDFQIVYSDTPGILDPKYKMQEGMMGFVNSALKDADIFLLLTDIYENIEKLEPVLKKVENSGVPLILLINKIDEGAQEKVVDIIGAWKERLPEHKVAPISALHGFNTAELLEYIVEKLPEGEPFFPKDALTDKPMRFFVSEIIREKILLNYKQEIPYSCEIVVEEFLDEEKIVKIRALILVNRESQKAIIIGQGGKAIKRMGTEARKELESFLEKKVFLDLFVKVDKDWRDDEKKLKRYGYLG